MTTPKKSKVQAPGITTSAVKPTIATPTVSAAQPAPNGSNGNAVPSGDKAPFGGSAQPFNDNTHRTGDAAQRAPVPSKSVSPFRDNPIFLRDINDDRWSPERDLKSFLKGIGLPMENEYVQQLRVVPSEPSGGLSHPERPETWLQANGFTHYRALLRGALVIPQGSWQKEGELSNVLRPSEFSRRNGMDVEFEEVANSGYRLNYPVKDLGNHDNRSEWRRYGNTVIWTQNPLLGVMAASKGLLVNVLTGRDSPVRKLPWESIQRDRTATAREILRNYEEYTGDIFGSNSNVFLFDGRDVEEKEADDYEYNVFRLLMEFLPSRKTTSLTIGPKSYYYVIGRYHCWNDLLSACVSTAPGED